MAKIKGNKKNNTLKGKGRTTRSRASGATTS